MFKDILQKYKGRLAANFSVLLLTSELFAAELEATLYYIPKPSLFHI